MNLQVITIVQILIHRYMYIDIKSINYINYKRYGITLYI